MMDMKNKIEPLSKSEIISLNKVMESIKYKVKRYNIAKQLSAGYCKVSLCDFDNDRLFVEVECRSGNHVDIEVVVIGRKGMELVKPMLIFNPENN